MQAGVGARSPRQDLTPLLRARCVAIVGISQPGRFGGILYDNLARMGYAGKVYGVNPRYDTLYDAPCYPSLADLPERPDCALLAVPNAGLVAALEDVADCGIPAAAIFASAWSEPGEEPSLQARMREVARAHGTVVCGPNCMGFVSPGERLPVSGYRVNPETPAGGVFFVSHSGSVWEGFLQNRRGIAFNHIVSPGNEMVTSVADYMQFALADPSTRVIGLFLETVRDPETFLAALEEAAIRDVPVVVLKTGRSEQGARFARAHSGALAGDDASYQAVFAHYGVHRVASIDEMFDTLELFATGLRPQRDGVAALLDSGGQRAHMVDLAESLGVRFGALSPATQAKLSEVLEPGLEPVNPLDAWGTGNGADDIYAESLRALDADPAVGLTLFAVDLPPLEDADAVYVRLAEELHPKLANPLAFLVHASSTASPVQMGRLRAAGIPVLMGTETGLRAVGHAFRHAAFQQRRQRAPAAAALPAPPPAERDALRERLRAATDPLDEAASKEILRAYGLTTPREQVVGSAAEAIRAAGEIGYPVALKTLGTAHKTEHGGVRLSLAGPDAVGAAYREMAERLGPRALVAEMVPDGPELLLGLVVDPHFGPMLSIGTGGILVEVWKDVRLLRLPTDEETIARALQSLRGAALLRGVRGRPPADTGAVVRAALGLASLAQDLEGCVAEIDVNPLIALPDRAVVVDALVVPGPQPHDRS